MPNAPINPGSPAAAERRRHDRVQPSGLVYLDIGTENGGIILDLNELGAGVQAVAPLSVLSKIPVRFQLPDSPKRLQTEAQVAWVSESRRRVGLHFVDVSDEIRNQISGWLRSQAAASAEPLQETDSFAPARSAATPPEAPREQWPNAPGDHASSDEHIGRFAMPETAFEAPGDRSLTENTDVTGAYLREVAMADIPEAIEADMLDTDTNLAAMPSGDETAAGKSTFTPETHRVERAEVIHWPAIIPAADPAAEPAALKSAVPVPKPPAVEKVPVSVSPSLTRRVTMPGAGFWTVAIAVAILLGISFEAGTWLGGGRLPIVSSSPARIPIQAVESGSDTLQEPTAARRSRAPVPQEHRAEHPEANLGSEEVNSPVPTIAPAPPAKEPDTPPSPPSLPNAPVVSIDASRETQVDPPVPNAGAPAQSPAGAVVDGHALGPTDRFNPAHLLYHFDPDYPPDAKQQNVEGTVMLRLSIGASGSVDQVRLLSGPPLLVPAAISAVRNWRYLPALLNGEPVKSEQDVSVEFRLPAER